MILDILGDYGIDTFHLLASCQDTTGASYNALDSVDSCDQLPYIAQVSQLLMKHAIQKSTEVDEGRRHIYIFYDFSLTLFPIAFNAIL